MVLVDARRTACNDGLSARSHTRTHTLARQPLQHDSRGAMQLSSFVELFDVECASGLSPSFAVLCLLDDDDDDDEGMNS